MKTRNVIITSLFVILSVGCSKEDNSPTLLIEDIESENISFEKSSIEEATESSEFN